MAVASASRTRSALRWTFRDRRTGRIVIAQRPNVPLLVWLIATATSWFVHGTAHTVIAGIGIIALVIWAGDEIVRGVNPWRRMLGTVVLGAVLVSWLTAS